MFPLALPNQKGLPQLCQEGIEKNELEGFKTFLFIYKIFLSLACRIVGLISTYFAHRLLNFILSLFSHYCRPFF